MPTLYNPKWENSYLTYRHILKFLNELAEKSRITKSVNPHAFRHARATFMARHLKGPEMREFFGWSKDSEMTAIYVSLSGRDVDNAVLSMYGIKDAEKSQEPVIKIWNCPRCNEVNEPASRFCKKCGLPIEATDTDKMESLLLDFLNTIGEAFPQVKEKFKEVARERRIDGLFHDYK
jgi:integrase/recombinase XerD